MPLSEHIEEMVYRILKVAAVALVGAILAFFFSGTLLENLWYSFVSLDPHTYHPLSKVITQLKLSAMVGIAISLPVLVYETFEFMKPGLYPNEKRYFISVVPVSVVLLGIGMGFSLFIALPILFDYFLYYSEGIANPGLGLRETFDLVIMFSLGMGTIFQIPLLMFLAIKTGVASRVWFKSKRAIVWGSCITISFLFSGAFDPTGVAGIAIALTMIGLFEFTLVLLKISP